MLLFRFIASSLTLLLAIQAFGQSSQDISLRSPGISQLLKAPLWLGQNLQSHKMRSDMAATPPMSMRLVAPLFIEDQYFTSELNLLNATKRAGRVDILVRSLDGTAILDKQLTISPNTAERIRIGDLLREAGSDETIGSIVVLPIAGRSIAAQLSLTYRKYRYPSYVDEELAMASSMGSPTLRAVGDNSNGAPIVSITSLAETAQKVQITCIREHRTQHSKMIDLAAGATVIVQSCTDDNAVNLEEELNGGSNNQKANDREFEGNSNEGESERRNTGAVGVALTSDGVPGSFAAFALAVHDNEDEKYLSALTFSDPAMIMSSTTIYAGVPVGPTAILPSGTYRPSVALANFGTENAHVTVTLATTMEGGGVSEKVVKTIAVPSGMSRSFTFEDLIGDARMRNSFLLKSDTKPGQVLTKLISLSDGAVHEIELLGKDEEEEMNAGTHPWSTEGGSDSTLLLLNSTASPITFEVVIAEKEIVWRKEYKLRPLETKDISIRDLVERQIVDDRGHSLPADLRRGIVIWSAPQRGVGKGRLLDSNIATAMARSFSCSGGIQLCAPPGYSAARITPPTANPLVIGDPWTFDVFYDMCLNEDPSYPPCTDTSNPTLGGNPSISWYDDNSNFGCQSGVLSSVLGQTGIYGQVTARGPGTGCVTVGVNDNLGCEAWANARANVDDFNISAAQTITDGQTAQFSMTITNGTASSYQWSFSAPSGSGNNPNVNFNPPNAANTTTDGHWFANPNQACPPTSANSTYTIKGNVTFSDGAGLMKSTQLTVSLPSAAGVTHGNISTVTGLPSMAADNPDGTGTWRITGIGSLTRVVPTNVVGPTGYEIFVPTTSQFFNKTFQHEQVHVNQWVQGTGHLFGDLFVAQTFFATIANLTGTSQDDLTQKIITARANFVSQEQDRALARKSQSEHDAYAVSDPINPQFFYQNCNRF